MSSNDIDLSQSGLEKVREILFGEEARSTRANLEDLSRRLTEALNALRDEHTSRLNEIERAAHAGLDAAAADALQARQAMEARLESSEAGLRKDLASRGDEQSAATLALQAALTGEITALRKEAEARHAELSERLATEFAQLRRDHVDRGELSALLTGLAERVARPVDGAGDAAAQGSEDRRSNGRARERR
jgi:hypothetical protein